MEPNNPDVLRVGDVMRWSLQLVLEAPVMRLQFDRDASVFVVVEEITREPDGTKTVFMRHARPDERPKEDGHD